MTKTPVLSKPKALPNGKVTYSSGGGLALLTLTNPPANGYSHAMMRDLDEAILTARFDDSIHVIVIAGAGEKFFCAGADIAMLNDVTPTFKYQFCLHANETLLRLEHTPKLVIAALSGHCVGGGLEIALACDLRIARKDSGKCGLPEIALGVLPGTGGTQRLVRVVGKSRAIELMATGRLMPFDEALALGLVTEVRTAANDEAFMQEVLAYAASFCTPAKAALSVGLIKRAVQTGAEIPLESGLALERELQARLFSSADAKEGIAAFVEKRTAHFEGR
ncbi:MAG: enoyl-CoA hydratase/isomerase family protein [Planctomycetes bacterium]|nr:enoyl-CoA hydratase/isomerase family protein [Planctomycetota bacterium]